MGCSGLEGFLRACRPALIVACAIAAQACGKAELGARESPDAGGAPGEAGIRDSVAGASAVSSGGVPASSGSAAVLGGSNQGGADAEDGGGGTSSGGLAAGGSGSAGIGNVWQGTVAPGTCGVSRRIRFPDVAPLSARPIRRQAGGFLLGPWVEAANAEGPLVAWLRIDASGELQTIYRARALPIDQTSFFLNVGAANQGIQLFTDSSGSGPAGFWSVVLNDPQSPPPYTSVVNLFKLSAFSLTYGFKSASQALDGQVGLLAVEATELSLQVIGANGSPVGERGTLRTSGLWECKAFQPTASAGAITAVAEDGSETFHSLELSATGEIAAEVQVPLHRARPPDWNASALPCPQLALTQAGIAFLVFESSADGDAWHIHRIARDGTTSDERWDTLAELPRGFAIQGSVSVAVTVRRDGTVTAVRRANGQDQQFPLSLEGTITLGGADGQFAAESGALFLDVSPLHGSGPRQIAEVSCP